MRGGRRRAKDSTIPERASSIIDTNRQFSINSNRDSDASFCSSRPSFSSSVGRIATVPINDRSYQSSAIRTINAYLSSHSVPFFLKPPLPSAKDITDTIRFIFNRLDWPTSSTHIKLDEDLPILLKHLNCPIKLNKSALKAPGTPHAWPSLLAVIHWLVQIALYNDHISSSSSSTSTITTHSFLQDNELLAYAIDNYFHYIRGDDDAVDALDREFTEKMEKERDSAANKVESLEKVVVDLEAKLEGMRTAPSAREVLEKDKSVLEEDVRKFHAMIDGFKSGIATLEKGLEENEKELETKIQENRRICEENEELKKKTDAQTVNMRDAERMKRELQAVERDIVEAEVARNSWEEKSWDLDATIGKKFKELENLSIECNQAIRRLKLGNDFQYMLNPKGSTPADVLGIDYKSTLKPALNAFADDIKRSSMAKLEELISLQQQSSENATKLEAKRSRLTELQSQIDTVESQLSLIKKETLDYTSRCAAEAKNLIEDVERVRHNMDTMEREAEEFLKISNAKLQDVIMQSDEEIQMCAREFLALVDSVSKYKEYMESTILEMKRDLSETAGTVANTYKSSLPVEFVVLSSMSQ